MNVYRILGLVLGLVTAAVLFALVAWGYVKRDTAADRLALQPCCPEQDEACCPENPAVSECCPEGESAQGSGQEVEHGTK